jgi:hypothetical protein
MSPKRLPLNNHPDGSGTITRLTSYICQNRPYRAPLDRLIPPFRGVVRKTSSGFLICTDATSEHGPPPVFFWFGWLSWLIWIDLVTEINIW